MANYTDPTYADVKDYCGVNIYVLGQTEAQLEALVTKLLVPANAEVSAIVGSAHLARTDLTEVTVALLQQATCAFLGALFLERPEVEEATGTAQPNLMDDADAYRKLIDARRERGADLCALALNALAAGSAPANEPQYITGFSDDDDRSITKTGDLW